MMLRRDRFSAGSRIRMKSAHKDATNTHSGTCEGSHLARSQSRPSDAALMLLLLLLLLLPHKNVSENAGGGKEVARG